MLQATTDPAVTRQLELIEEQLASTWKNHDCAGWSALLAEDWSVTHIDAQVLGEAASARDVPYRSARYLNRRSAGGSFVR